MKTALKTSGNKIIYRDFPSPALQATDIRVKVKACGICGTDLHTPLAPGQNEVKFGHEIAGTIIEAGVGVKHLQPGDNVALDSATPCGHCDFCRNKQAELCSDIQSFYFYDNFGFAEEIVVPAISAIKFSDLSFAEVTLQEPLGVALDLFQLSEIRPGQNVLIIGCGTIGMMLLPLLRRAGVDKLFVSDYPGRRDEQQNRQFDFATSPADSSKEKIAQKYAVTDCIPRQQLSDYQFPCRLDRILVTAPPATLSVAMQLASPTAIISYIGIGHDHKMVSFDADAFHFKKLQLRASFASPAHYGAESVKLLEQRIVDPADYITHTLPFDQLEQAMAIASNKNSIKVVVTI